MASFLFIFLFLLTFGLALLGVYHTVKIKALEEHATRLSLIVEKISAFATSQTIVNRFLMQMPIEQEPEEEAEAKDPAQPIGFHS